MNGQEFFEEVLGRIAKKEIEFDEDFEDLLFYELCENEEHIAWAKLCFDVAERYNQLKEHIQR